MATTRSAPYGMACPHCNTSLIAPDGSRYVSKHEVYHFWSCEDCGHRIESVVDFRNSITSKLINHVDLTFSGEKFCCSSICSSQFKPVRPSRLA
jgi:hypothetical protein